MYDCQDKTPEPLKEDCQETPPTIGIWDGKGVAYMRASGLMP